MFETNESKRQQIQKLEKRNKYVGEILALYFVTLSLFCPVILILWAKYSLAVSAFLEKSYYPFVGAAVTMGIWVVLAIRRVRQSSGDTDEIQKLKQELGEIEEE